MEEFARADGLFGARGSFPLDSVLDLAKSKTEAPKPKPKPEAAKPVVLGAPNDLARDPQEWNRQAKQAREQMGLPEPDLLMIPPMWGRAEWAALLAEAFSFPDKPSPQQIEAMVARVTVLQYLLPCPKCRKHWASMLEKHPIRPVLEQQGGPGLRAWIVERHNDVNRRRGTQVVPLDHVCKTYNQGNLFKYLSLGLGILCLLLLVGTVVLLGTVLSLKDQLI